MSQTAVRKAVIPVAGLGTRFLPQTKAFPKELLPIVDQPVIQYIVEEAVAAGIEDIVFVISEDKVAIEKHFARNAALEEQLKAKGKLEELGRIEHLHSMARFFYTRQDEPRGLGHAVLQAEDIIGNEPFVVFGGDDIMECDVPAAKQLIDTYLQHKGVVLGVIEVPREDVVRYGIIAPGEMHDDGSLVAEGIVEKPSVEEAPSQFGVAGRWLVTPEIFTYLHATTPDKSGEIQITEALKAMIADGRPVFAKPMNGIYRDCGNKLEYLKAVIAYAVKHPELGPAITSYIKTLGV